MDTIELPAVSDPLGEALHFLRMSSAFTCRSEMSAPWGVELPPMPGLAMFHVVSSGSCWLEVAGEPALQMGPGDFVLVPHGHGHVFRDAPKSPAINIFDLDRFEYSPRYELLRHGGGGQTCVSICGAVQFDHPAAIQLLKLLPPVLHIDTWESEQAGWVQSILRMISAEARELRPGGEAVITRLSDVLVIQAIRFWIANSPKAQTGWIGALQDPQLGRVIAMVHRQPELPWTLESLAAEAAMSRSNFAARFAEKLGETPMRYVARWRMYTALRWIREDNVGFGEAAERLGYQSEAAFHRAFKRVMGQTPGAARAADATSLALAM